MMYLIGGAHGTGRSDLSKMILKRKKISTMSTNVLVFLLKGFAKKIEDDNQSRYIAKATNFFPYLRALIEANVLLGVEDYVYEGDIILPESVYYLSQEFSLRSCFLGFSHVDIAMLENMGTEHLSLDNPPKEKFVEMANCIVEVSSFIRQECEKYGLKYFDIADEKGLVFEEAYTYLMN